MGRTMRLLRFGIVASAVAAAVWWAMQRRQEQQSTPLGSAADPSGPLGAGAGAGRSGSRSRGVLPSEELVDLSQAARVLEVDESRIPVMVEGGMLEPVGGDGGSGAAMRFRRAEVEAVRLQGG